ncbi:MAG: hypothetical protein IPL61_20325 [Myxococcales bacterium]|nr:hypothetical protein [Myxococcales bacterium]
MALIDVDRAAAGDRILELLGLEPGERVLAIDGEPAALEDVPAIWRDARPGEFLDLLVSWSDRLRRVLVLVHR